MKHYKLSIQHIPLGNEQPYFQQPFERFPRYPKNNQNVVVGAVIDPVDAAERVDLIWMKDGEQTAGIVSAICVGASDSVGNSGCDRYWIASLPGLPGGTAVSYQLRASNGVSSTETEIFTYTVAKENVYDSYESCFVDEKGRFVMTLSSGEKHAEQLHWIWEREGETIHTQFSVERTLKGTTDADRLLSISRRGEIECVQYEAMEFQIRRNPFMLQMKPMSSSDVQIQSAGPISCSAYPVGDGVIHREITINFTAGDQESFYGFGERYNRLDQSGEVIENRVFEQYRNQRLKTYLPVPFFLSKRGYGNFIKSDRTIRYDMGAQDIGTWGLTAEMGDADALDMFWFFGTPKEIVSGFCRESGGARQPPDWAFGPWMSSNEWNSQKRVLKEVKKSDDLDIPATVVVIEAWSDEATFYCWNEAEYTPKSPEEPMHLDDFSFPEEGLWPDPKGMIDTLHEEGKRLILWQIPIVKAFLEGEEIPEQHIRDAVYVQEQGLCLREADGSPYTVRPGWFHDSMVIDLSAQKAQDWWFQKREYLMKECGVDGFKTDGGEHIWGYSVRPSAARSEELQKTGATEPLGDRLINTYPAHYLEAYKKAMDKSMGKGNGVTFSRSGYTGVQQTPCHWTGDQGSTWEAYRGVVNAVLSANISGIPFIGWDIGGFSGDIPSAELYLRSTSTAALSPIMQYHSEYHDHTIPHVDRTPWNIAECHKDNRVLAIYRLYAKLRMALLPYSIQEASWCCEQGEPLMRPLWFDNPEDEQCWKIEDQYCFGRALLVAPVLHRGETKRRIYLPAGMWKDCWRGESIDGNRWIERDAPLEIIPVYRELSAHWPLSDELFSTYLSTWGK